MVGAVVPASRDKHSHQSKVLPRSLLVQSRQCAKGPGGNAKVLVLDKDEYQFDILESTNSRPADHAALPLPNRLDVSSWLRLPPCAAPTRSLAEHGK